VITEDVKIIQGIFQLIDTGIAHGYDAFHYGVEWGEGYIETELAVEKDGVESWNAEHDYNGAIMLHLVDQLKENADKRGEPWKSFVLSYREGEQVTTKFNYD